MQALFATAALLLGLSLAGTTAQIAFSVPEKRCHAAAGYSQTLETYAKEHTVVPAITEACQAVTLFIATRTAVWAEVSALVKGMMLCLTTAFGLLLLRRRLPANRRALLFAALAFLGVGAYLQYTAFAAGWAQTWPLLQLGHAQFNALTQPMLSLSDAQADQALQLLGRFFLLVGKDCSVGFAIGKLLVWLHWLVLVPLWVLLLGQTGIQHDINAPESAGQH